MCCNKKKNKTEVFSQWAWMHSVSIQIIINFKEIDFMVCVVKGYGSVQNVGGAEN